MDPSYKKASVFTADGVGGQKPMMLRKSAMRGLHAQSQKAVFEKQQVKGSSKARDSG